VEAYGCGNGTSGASRKSYGMSGASQRSYGLLVCARRAEDLASLGPLRRPSIVIAGPFGSAKACRGDPRVVRSVSDSRKAMVRVS